MEMWFKTSQKMFPKKKNLTYTWEYDKASTYCPNILWQLHGIGFYRS